MDRHGRPEARLVARIGVSAVPYVERIGDIHILGVELTTICGDRETVSVIPIGVDDERPDNER